MSESIPTHAVKAVITNGQGEILFLQRNPEIRDSGNFDLPGGLVEDESDEEALKREVAEELGVEIEVGPQVGSWKFHRPLDNKEVTVSNFACRILGENTLELSVEHIAARWVARAAVRELQVKDSSLFEALG